VLLEGSQRERALRAVGRHGSHAVHHEATANGRQEAMRQSSCSMASTVEALASSLSMVDRSSRVGDGGTTRPHCRPPKNPRAEHWVKATSSGSAFGGQGCRHDGVRTHGCVNLSWPQSDGLTWPHLRPNACRGQSTTTAGGRRLRSVLPNGPLAGGLVVLFGQAVGACSPTGQPHHAGPRQRRRRAGCQDPRPRTRERPTALQRRGRLPQLPGHGRDRRRVDRLPDQPRRTAWTAPPHRPVRRRLAAGDVATRVISTRAPHPGPPLM